MLSAILTLFGGGLSGLLGSAITSIVNYKMKGMEFKHAEDMRRLEIDGMTKEHELAMERTKVEFEGKINIAELEALKETYKNSQTFLFDQSYFNALFRSSWTSWIGAIIAFMFGIVDFMKHLARPLLTYYVMGLATYVTIVSYNILEKAQGGAISVDTAEAIFRDSVSLIFYLTTTAFSWWFCDRRIAKFAAKFLDK